MASAGEGDDTGGGGHGGTPGHCGVALNFNAMAVRNHGLESGSRNRKTIVMSRNSNKLVGSREAFDAACDDSRISMDIKNKKLHEDMKDLRFCEENRKLRVEMDLKNKEMQCLRKQNEELQAKYKDLQIKYRKQNEELHAKYGKQNVHAGLHKNIDAKRKQLRQLEGLYSTMEFPSIQLEEGKRLANMSCDEGVLVPNPLFMEQCLELEVADLDAEIRIKMEKLGIGENMLGHMNIGIKRMGEINYLSLRKACLRKYRKDEAEVNASILASFWSQELRKPSWHPFKVVEIGGRLKSSLAAGVINDDDAKLKLMQDEFGDDACNAVKTALTMELNEYNPSERQPVPEFWNFGKGRKATVEEILKFMFSRLRKRHRA
ncbi:hypothetical protein PR202_ga23488 [Eleusine coracana subsp. coracana]|uniref:Factor of DNA methylation 1-5/IDN2 domain-containing protein n=1 Tax=Eleusine coracana subsp. coracana TaxID=191504 RepID=A0AAV5D5V7_ELECO|nr:hypothetical protein PR202_ga23488 [Eleusine coracana subsp. coracana]